MEKLKYNCILQDTMPINETVLLAGSILGPFAKIMAVLQGLIGGLFGLYFILVLLRWKEYRKMSKLLNQIKIEVAEINEKLSKKTSRKKKK